MTNIKQILTAFLATAFLGVQANIFTDTNLHLVQWTFAENVEPTTVASGASASTFQNSAGLTHGPFSSGPGPALNGSSYPENEPVLGAATALPNNEAGRTFGRVFNNLDTMYHHFSVTAVDQSFTLANIGFDVGWRDGGGDEMRVQYSFASDFSDPITVIHMKGYTDPADVDQLGLGPVDSLTGLPTIGISDPDINNLFYWNRYVFEINDTLEQGDTVYFRIQGNGGSGSANIHMDNVTLAIPEPGTLVLLGFVGVVGLVGFRRRR